MDLTDALERMSTACAPMPQGPGRSHARTVGIVLGADAGAAVATVADTSGRASAPITAADSAIRDESMQK
ncbi:hypothetical protein CP972_00690 [Streptomyces prasinus]|uniref:CBS domain-containing protein n=1 Tax=Streptomyces prasinus TaxID=67345 RepID=A0ABX6AR82_9ACTN|nr:hypothetical protein CP972_00690 [Streptomyces prasinus]